MIAFGLGVWGSAGGKRALRVVAGLLVPATIVSVFTLRQQEQALARQLNADLERITEVMSLDMAPPMWHMNAAEVPLFDVVLSDERVVSVVARDTKFGIFLSREYPELVEGYERLYPKKYAPPGWKAR